MVREHTCRSEIRLIISLLLDVMGLIWLLFSMSLVSRSRRVPSSNKSPRRPRYIPVPSVYSGVLLSPSWMSMGLTTGLVVPNLSTQILCSFTHTVMIVGICFTATRSVRQKMPQRPIRIPNALSITCLCNDK